MYGWTANTDTRNSQVSEGVGSWGGLRDIFLTFPKGQDQRYRRPLSLWDLGCEYVWGRGGNGEGSDI